MTSTSCTCPNPGRAEEILTALDRLVAAGKVLAIGTCNYASWRLAEAAHTARELGTATFVSVQNYYHLLARQTEQEVASFCAAYGLGILPYHPLGGGFLTGKYRRGHPRRPVPAGPPAAASSPR
ncbi:aldo/keto reductase [Pseudonocardia acidicola]|uniref:aldo/keto reductase n=1 Tax=Pseudonocardia acidicola TaxID=2724939 RepID=UPI001EF00C3D|nr:aldo/keto reductase [Pseudonocardia acidicola]